MARLANIKTLSGFHFSFQPSLGRNRIMAFAALDSSAATRWFVLTLAGFAFHQIEARMRIAPNKPTIALQNPGGTASPITVK